MEKSTKQSWHYFGKIIVLISYKTTLEIYA